MNKYYVNKPIIIKQNLSEIPLLKLVQTDVNNLLSNQGIDIITPVLIHKKGKSVDIIISSLEQADLLKNHNFEFVYGSKDILYYDNFEEIIKVLFEEEKDLLIEILNNKVVIMRKI